MNEMHNRSAMRKIINEIKDIAVLHMTVPCCSQLAQLVSEAVHRSGKDVPQKSYVVGIDGKLKIDG
jgi:hypothetical protein